MGIPVAFGRKILPRARAARRRGSALIVALVAVTVAFSMGAAFLTISTSASRRQTNEIEDLRAFYVAEAGLAEAFHSLRMGRSGQIASRETPASFGDGLLWVDATNVGTDRVRLESTALCGRGRSSLALIVEPVTEPLGIFSDEDLVVDDVLLVDGYDSSESPYEEQLPQDQITIDRDYEFLFIDEKHNLLFYEGLFYRFHTVEGDTFYFDHTLDHRTLIDQDEYEDFDLDFDDFIDDDAHEDFEDDEYEGVLHYFRQLPDQQASPSWGPPPFGEDDGYTTGWAFEPTFDRDVLHTTDLGHDLEYTTSSFGEGDLGDSLGSEADSTLDDHDWTELSVTDVAPVVSSGEHTGSGGLLGSNGNVSFNAPTGESIEIWGDAVAGPEGSVQGSGDFLVSGESESRSAAVELVPVEVPTVVRAAPVRHDGVLPLLIAPGTTGYERIEVAADAELVVRGPATVVIDTLVLEPGALLCLDTRDGNVELYVTGGADLQEGSIVTTTGELSEEVSIQVAALPSTEDGAPVKLESTAQFHGTIYAPETEVLIGADFELFGSVVARRLDIASGARLHFDRARYASPIPRIVSWRIVEIPAAVRTSRTNAFALLGVTPAETPALADAHDLECVALDIDYVDQAGAELTFAGMESDFDWNDVSEVTDVDRIAIRRDDDEGDDGGSTDDADSSWGGWGDWSGWDWSDWDWGDWDWSDWDRSGSDGSSSWGSGWGG